MTPFVTPYSADVEAAMQTFFGSLREKDRRRYAAVEAAKLGPGGIPYLARLLGIDPNTIRRGLAELRDLPDLPPERVRRPGGGRKKKLDAVPRLADNLRAVLRDHTAGSPVDEALYWTDLTAADIVARLAERGTPVSAPVVEQLLDREGYRRRRARKALPLGAHRDRDAQFRNLARLTAEYLDSPNPVLSIDTKKRELLGSFHRDGVLLTRRTLLAFDHDFPRFADGVVIPYGLYDLRRNEGYVHLGTSHDTSAFACDCLEDWWRRFGRGQYPRAAEWLLLCDGGGSNSARTYLFKQDLQAVANRLGLAVRVAHYPPYCSKYNPIEHRLFPHLTRACQGVLFTSVALVQQLMAKARTRTGLRVVVDVLDRVYETGRRVSAAAKRALHLVRDTLLPDWNYRLLPQTQHGQNPFGMDVI